MRYNIFIMVITLMMITITKVAKSQSNENVLLLNGQADNIDIEIKFDSSNLVLYVLIANRNDCAILLDTNIIYINVNYNAELKKISFTYSNHPDRIREDETFNYFNLISVPKDSVLEYKIYYTKVDRIVPSNGLPILSFSFCYIKETDFPDKPLNTLLKLDYGEWLYIPKQFILLERSL